MAQEQGEYRVGRGKPPLHTRFRKGRSGNPKGPRKKDLPALLLAALDEPVTVDKDGRRRRISKREAIVAQLVDKSADADLRATKMLIDMLKEIERKVAPPPEAAAETRPLGRGDVAILQHLVARLRRQYLAEIAGADPARSPPGRSPSGRGGLAQFPPASNPRGKSPNSRACRPSPFRFAGPSLSPLAATGFTDRRALHKDRHSGGRAERGSPESMNTGLWKMGSGLAAEPVLGPRAARTRGRRPGMTPPLPAFPARPPLEAERQALRDCS